MLAKTKVLAVSHDQVLVKFLHQELKDSEFEVIPTQYTGIQLKNVLEAERPGFIILDIVMPSLEGIGICLQLRQWTDVPVMMLSSWGAGNGTVRGLDLSSENYLTKSFGGDVLRRKINDTLKRNNVVDFLPNLRTV